MQVSAILLSAGLSSRMRPLPHKGLLKWKGKTLIEHQIQMLLNSNLSEIIVVLGHEAKEFFSITNRYPVKTVFNENYLQGKCSSIIKGLQSIDCASDMILITAVDQPIDATVINQLIQSLQDSNSLIAIPINNGKRGHPILFSKNIIHALLSIREETQGLRNIIRQYENEIVEAVIDNTLVTQNINTPMDYRKALEITITSKVKEIIQNM
ncbi:nucleotidyltransferase family protein [Bacillus sp. DTU_2020_1000418_1_SI_GHA_SEK_038]|uniref:nucleotidyltransferase family protein n=1 Tax=Bacillus sp. DTU_2020_1000418_1_SI_GHA_SEK_038 TaxID=3077585 RepID=UPI0028E27862|nr:nucleotidyltransferase family protein [Bacillus sp. DTU_2020_1000418_1_SI_GHA_SEK_038]WNS77394.1 nucleotidyltransferase family protein [Bacillus sp. DTU_2020_1000418_1_SI_GHA_SEK_038]